MTGISEKIDYFKSLTLDPIGKDLLKIQGKGKKFLRSSMNKPRFPYDGKFIDGKRTVVKFSTTKWVSRVFIYGF
jgi:hypothetical protein